MAKMFRIAVASGKGGTGKTCVASSLSLTAGNAVAVDVDVEEPNLAILLGADMDHYMDVTVPLPVIDGEKCIRCGKCVQSCRFGALAMFGDKPPIVNNSLCNGCGTCSIVCPTGAISETERPVGALNYGEEGELKILEGCLKVGVFNSIPVIEKTLNEAEKWDTTQIIDCSPGTSCPMVAAVGRADYVVLVTEPTPFGLADLALAMAVVKDLNIPAGVVVNRSDLSGEDLEPLCRKFDMEVLARLPFSRQVAKAYAGGLSPVRVDAGWQEAMKTVLSKAEEAVQ
jgi:MinD superfamily P-loop ATPase